MSSHKIFEGTEKSMKFLENPITREMIQLMLAIFA